jgi:hypothetical protein
VRGAEEWYVSKYGTKSADERHHVRVLDPDTGEIRYGAPRMRIMTCSRGYGDTMAEVKAQQRAWMLERLAVQDTEREARARDAARERTTDREAPASGPPAAPG